VRRPKTRPAYVPPEIWEQAKHLILVCDEHQTWVLAGTCSQCQAGRYAGLEGSRGVDAGPAFIKRYLSGPCDGDGELSVQPQANLQPIEDPYAPAVPIPRLVLGERCNCVTDRETGALHTPCAAHQRQAERWQEGLHTSESGAD
jgi:hypothetical protein